MKDRGYQSRLLRYTQSASWFRVFAVCSLSFTPAFVVAFLIELLPLRQPNEGWEANWVYWIRFFLSIVAITFGVGIQVTMLIPASGLTVKHAVFIALGTSVGCVLSLIVIAQLWCFPVPFSLVVANPAWELSLFMCVRVAIGKKKSQENPEINKQASAARPLLYIQSGLIMIYPAYNALFLRLRGIAQVAFVLLLPVIKFLMSFILLHVSSRIPAASAYGLVTVELFDALYLFKCMQSAGSIYSGAGLITVDLIQNIYHLRNLHKRVELVKKDLARTGVNIDYKDIVHKSMGRAAIKSRSFLRLQATDLTNAPMNSVVPSSASAAGVHSVKSIMKATLASKFFAEKINSALLDKSISKLLMECERLVVIEFIECAVPMFYALYLIALYHLPNAKFYPEMQQLDTVKLSQTAKNIAIYAFLEVASLLYIHFLLYWKLRISVLHLLANVLERENGMLQGIFMTWVIIILQFTLEHNGASGPHIGLLRGQRSLTVVNTLLGVDFSFDFRWV